MVGKRPSTAVVIPLVLALAFAGSCGGGGGNSKTSGPPTSTTATAASPSCRFTRDRVRPAVTPLIQVQAPGEATPAAITQQQNLTCATIVRVSQRGAADSFFGADAACQLTQDNPDAGKIARLTTRDPPNDLFRLVEGRVRCTMAASGTTLTLCDMGTLLMDGATQGRITCDPEPVFEVAAFAGTLRVTDPAGHEFDVAPGTQLTFDFEVKASTVGRAVFTVDDVGAFAAQAEGLHLRVVPAVTPPVLESPPTVSSSGFGAEVIADPGEWSGWQPITFTYLWQGGCDAEGNGCHDVPGATDSRYRPIGTDCPNVRVIVTATNVAGSAMFVSDPFDLNCIE